MSKMIKFMDDIFNAGDDFSTEPTKELSLMAKRFHPKGSCEVYEDVIVTHRDRKIVSVQVYNRWLDEWVFIDMKSNDVMNKKLIELIGLEIIRNEQKEGV